MNVKRWIWTSLLVFIVYEIVSSAVHMGILAPSYQALEEIWRADMMSIMWVMYIADLIMAFTFTWIFARGYESKGILEGVRFGAIASLFVVIPGMLNQYVVYPVPFSLAIQWIIFGVIEFVIMGIIASLVYKTK